MNPVLQSVHHEQLRDSSYGYYRLVWRSKTLMVSRSRSPEHQGVYVRDLEWATACLRRSPVHRVKLGSDLTAAELVFWANASAAAGCSVYLSLPKHAHLPQQQKPLHWWFKCVIDKVVAFSVLLMLSPMFLGMALLVRSVSRSSILVSQWHVGARGRLYRVNYFRTRSKSGEPLPFALWVRQYRLDRLPKLMNVLRGEMSIVGACPKRLTEVPQIEVALRSQLNSLPGITGAWQLEGQLAQLDWRFLHHIDLEYLGQWSLRGDLGYLVLTAPKMLVEKNL